MGAQFLAESGSVVQATQPAVATLIGDVIGSRRYSDRGLLQRRLDSALHAAGRRIPAVQPVEVSLGDEFQGVYARPADAVRAALLIRLELLPEIDTRYGLGWGTIEVFDPARRPAAQNGPGWWAARDALTEVEQRAGQTQSRHLRTWFVDRTAEDSVDSVPLSAMAGFAVAFMSVRDEIIANMDERKLRLLRGVLAGATQAELAEAEGVTQSAVSQLLTRSGAHAVRLAHEQLGSVLP